MQSKNEHLLLTIYVLLNRFGIIISGGSSSNAHTQAHAEPASRQRKNETLSAVECYKWVKKVKRPKASVRFEHLVLLLDRFCCCWWFFHLATQVISSFSSFSSMRKNEHLARFFSCYFPFDFALNPWWNAHIYLPGSANSHIGHFNVIKVNDELRSVLNAADIFECVVQVQVVICNR